MAASSPALSPGGGNVVPVRINLNSHGKVRSLDPDNFDIIKAQHQQVFWYVSDGNAHFNVEFIGDSPFDYKQFSDAEPYSGLVRREVLADPNKCYTYNVTVTLGSKVSTHKGSKGFDPGGYVK